MGATLTQEQFDRIQNAVFAAAERLHVLERFGLDVARFSPSELRILHREVTEAQRTPEELTAPPAFDRIGDNYLVVVFPFTDATLNVHIDNSDGRYTSDLVPR